MGSKADSDGLYNVISIFSYQPRENVKRIRYLELTIYLPEDLQQVAFRVVSQISKRDRST